ncbi:Twin-arginine translocation pathway signal [Salipiger abyssi]|uniref:Twin-arginine translocation pathway signal n=1 Tax=Salipiger abyssi TaxID=1250539 RepID=UPI001A8D0219|nr:Twin-arginine translocation pathway signal [Salipiger abyssi]MBN9887805.1 Twin-arginine translocation pathway signal [Salipiger abyssi]
MRHQDAGALTGAPLPMRELGGLVIGSGFVAGAGWAMELAHLAPEHMAALILLARDLYPHGALHDEAYAKALLGYDRADEAREVATGIATLDSAALGFGYRRYVDMPKTLRAGLRQEIPDSAFLARLRRRLVTGLYGQPAVCAAL